MSNYYILALAIGAAMGLVIYFDFVPLWIPIVSGLVALFIIFRYSNMKKNHSGTGSYKRQGKISAVAGDEGPLLEGALHFQNGDYELSIAEYTIAIGINPNNANTYLHRGLSYLHTDQLDNAFADFTQAIAINIRFPEGHFFRGIIYAKSEKYREALAEYDKAIEIDPNYDEAYFHRGTTKGFLFDHVGSKEDLETSLRLAKQQGNSDCANRAATSLAMITPFTS